MRLGTLNYSTVWFYFSGNAELHSGIGLLFWERRNSVRHRFTFQGTPKFSAAWVYFSENAEIQFGIGWVFFCKIREIYQSKDWRSQVFFLRALCVLRVNPSFLF